MNNDYHIVIGMWDEVRTVENNTTAELLEKSRLLEIARVSSR